MRRPALTDTAISGIHHVTAIAGDPQANIDFYTRVLGLRMIKLAVNFDAPDTYHFYYGNADATPGSAITFFPFADAAPGRPGAGMADVTAYAIPETAFDYWVDRLAGQGGEFEGPTTRFGEQVLGLRDPDGLKLELVAERGLLPEHGWGEGGVPAEHAIQRFHSVVLNWQKPDRSMRLLTEVFGYEPAGEEGGRMRFRTPGEAGGQVVDVVSEGRLQDSRPGTGTVHHVAFRARDDAEHAVWRERIAVLGLNVTEIIDRNYFHSIYFREPNGVLFEIATDGPGFAIDEAPDRLGTKLMLPPWYEPKRAEIERRLPPIRLPRANV